MDIYTVGRLALPVVVLILAVAAVMTLVASIFTVVKTLSSVQHLLQRMEQSGHPSVTINILTGRQSSEPPMQEKD